MAEPDATKERVRAQFGRAAAGYATSAVHARGESLAVLLATLRLRPADLVLDVATGAGHTALAVAPRVARVVAVDLTTPMLAQVVRLAAERGLTTVEPGAGDAEALPFPDARFDVVTCRLAFHHFPHPERAMGEMARVLKPGGVFGVTDNVCVADPAAVAHYNAYERLRDPSHHRVVSLGALAQHVEAVGLRIDVVRRLEKEFEFHDWADRQRVAAADKARLLAMLRTMPPALRPLLAPRFADGTAWFTLWEAVLVGTKPG